MRQSQSNRRGRGRGRKAQNPLTKNYESNGPDVKIRGTAAHISEKYNSLARDALASSDIISHENYLQHAEHYNRIIMAAQLAQAEANNDAGDQVGDADAETDQHADGQGNNGQKKKQNRRRRPDNGQKNDRNRKNISAKGEHLNGSANGKGDHGDVQKIEVSSNEPKSVDIKSEADDAAA